MNIDFGLSVTFDGKAYTLICADHIKKYPVGGLICEYARLSPPELKPILLSCNGLENEVNVDNLINLHLELHEKLMNTFPPVMATMISLEFMNGITDWSTAIREDRIDELMGEIFSSDNTDAIKDFILEGTPFKEFGCDNMLHVLLSCYYSFALSYVNVKYMFLNIIGDYKDSEQREKVINSYSQMYGELLDMQHIDYRIMSTIEKGLESLFTIKTSLSLLLFEMANAQKIDQNFTKCANCNNFFVPEGRCDAIYCTYPSPQNKNKTCKEIGAQVARANKEKTDVVTGAYRKTYMRYKMMTKRHPYDKEKQQIFKSLTEGMKEWRTKLSSGTSTTDDFLKWLEQFN